MKFPIDKEWFEKGAAAEGDLEIGAGSRKTMTLNLTDEELSELEKLANPTAARLREALEANQQVIETLRAAMELSREWIGILRGSCGDVSMQMGDDRDPSVLEEAVYSKIAAALSDNPEGDGNA